MASSIQSFTKNSAPPDFNATTRTWIKLTNHHTSEVVSLLKQAYSTKKKIDHKVFKYTGTQELATLQQQKFRNEASNPGYRKNNVKKLPHNSDDALEDMYS